LIQSIHDIAENQPLKVLTLSDVEMGFLYSPQILPRFGDTDLVISCGDLPYHYLEYILTMLNAPLLYVRGNHNNQAEATEHGDQQGLQGAVNLDQKCIRYRKLLIAGVEGCNRYNKGPVQYTQSDYWTMIFRMTPLFFGNRLRYGRFLDVFVSHAPPWGIHDLPDLAHQGIKAFRWLMDVFKPIYHFHGHVHHYQTMAEKETLYKETLVINTYGYRETQIHPGVRVSQVLTRPVAGSSPVGESRSKSGGAGPRDSDGPQSG
jgi:hypothetical protein